MDGEWHYDHANRVYYHPKTATYAVQDLAGQWSYHAASDFTLGEGSGAGHLRGQGSAGVVDGEKEEGEIQEDVGWGGLMEPEEVDKVLKEKARQNGRGMAYPHVIDAGSTVTAWNQEQVEEEESNKDNDGRLLRLVVLESECLEIGGVAVLDTREGGIQLGRDRCEKGSTARVRLKEMAVSKSHAVVYWGEGGEWEEGWWIVDLGSSFLCTVTVGQRVTEADSRFDARYFARRRTTLTAQTFLQAR